MTFDRALWQQARPLFDELVELDADARKARLKQLGEENPELKSVVERLLKADVGEQSDSRFDSNQSASQRDANPRDPLGIIGKNISHFTVTDYLAAGGMGVVYTAHDLQLNRAVALKFPLPHQQMDLLVKERFMNEARSAASLDHPNLCTVHEIAESEHGVFLAMPLYPGETLKDRIARQGALSPDEAVAIAQQITTGLITAHAAGIVHRDLKPGNIMLLPDGTIKVLDFGLAKIRDISLTMSHTTLGTIGYVAPEQIRGGKVDARADLWSIGVMLYEMLTSELPFKGDHELSVLHNIMNTDPPLPSQLKPGIAPKFDQLVSALLQKHPDARYPSAAALLSDLNALRAGGTVAHRGPFWSRTTRRRRARRMGFPAVLVISALFIAALSWYLGRGTDTAAGKTPAVKFVRNSAVIKTRDELVAALVPANAGRTIHIRSGTYDIDQPLTVPDGMTIEGDGVMITGEDGRATGFRDGPHTILRMTASTGGDVLTLGNKVILRNIEIVDLSGRSGNVVAIASRRQRDTVAATIESAVIVNPNPFAIGPGGALGRALHISTRNANMGADPAADEGSIVSVKVDRSVIKSPEGGGGFFAFNFAPDSRISLDIAYSTIGGTNEANGGVSRPDAVFDSEVRITSKNTLYRDEWEDPCASALIGWNLTGGSGAPIPMQLPATVRNRLVMRSNNDRIEGFTLGILATAARRFYPEPRNKPPRHNHIELQLIGTRISTPACDEVRATSNTPVASAPETVTDIRMLAAEAPNGRLVPGDSNSIRAELRGVTGSGRRANVFDTDGGGRQLAASVESDRSSSASFPANLRGKGNRIEIVGDLATFMKSNRGIDPAPAAQFFIGNR